MAPDEIYRFKSRISANYMDIKNFDTTPEEMKALHKTYIKNPIDDLLKV